MKERYLIFGSGFIAEHYARHLLVRGAIVRILFHRKKNPRLPASLQKKMPSHLSGIIRSLTAENPRYLILTQGISFIPDNEKELRKSVESNVISPTLVLEAVYQLQKQKKMPRLKKILTFGSAAEYGDSDTKRWTENERDTKPTSLYGLTKHWLFESSQFYANLGVPCVHLRLFNTIGAGQHPNFVVSSFARQTAMIEREMQKRQLTVGDLNQKRDFLDIRDFGGACGLILKGAKPGQVVNVCSGTTHSVRRVAEILRELSLVPFSLRKNPALFTHKRTRNKELSGSPAWLRENGWKPRYDLRASVSWTLDYWRNELK